MNGSIVEVKINNMLLRYKSGSLVEFYPEWISKTECLLDLNSRIQLRGSTWMSQYDLMINKVITKLRDEDIS